MLPALSEKWRQAQAQLAKKHEDFEGSGRSQSPF
jgi:hypothetical protein